MFALAPKSIFWSAPKTSPGARPSRPRTSAMDASYIALAQHDKLPSIAQALASKGAATLRFVVCWKEAI